MATAPEPTIEPKSWEWGIGPHAIGLFLWIAYFDRLAPRTLAVGGLMPAVLGALAGGVVAFGLLYYAPAMLGLRTRQPIEVLAAGPFGRKGAAWATGLVIAGAQFVAFAVAVSYGVEFIFRGLGAARILDNGLLLPGVGQGPPIGGLPMWFTAIFWGLAASLIGFRFSRWIGALMTVFPIFPALALGGLAVWGMAGLAGGDRPPMLVPTEAARVAAFFEMVQFVFGFCALPAMIAPAWGLASRGPRDVRLGGLVGIALAAPTVAALALLTVLGAGTRLAAVNAAGGVSPAVPFFDAATLTWERSLLSALGGPPAGAALLLFGLSSLAPAVYAAYWVGARFNVFPKRRRRLRMMALLTLTVLPFALTGAAFRTDVIFGVFGAFLAPIAGILTADSLRRRGVWSGPRRGWSPSGLVAWAVGAAIGLLPYAGMIAKVPALVRIQPAAVLAFAGAFLTYSVLSALGWQTALEDAGPHG